MFRRPSWCLGVRPRPYRRGGTAARPLEHPSDVAEQRREFGHVPAGDQILMAHPPDAERPAPTARTGGHLDAAAPQRLRLLPPLVLLDVVGGSAQDRRVVP